MLRNKEAGRGEADKRKERRKIFSTRTMIRKRGQKKVTKIIHMHKRGNSQISTYPESALNSYTCHVSVNKAFWFHPSPLAMSFELHMQLVYSTYSQ